ncbi:Do/DeqQ family serine protease [Faunimonas pinastri]|uniref:Do/DeqQ family serine protease n=1 Tax=Faunimonas pinastri TaxID=1855383 RepID=A0A1H9KN68_9HYPH|nr:DegQ family serine endoprotease [Faunimonas pinastri]SER00293.1 Do/DeqQ family serine protease [Faunimonas pinastri]
MSALALSPYSDALAQEQAPQSRQEITLSFAPVVKRAAPAVVNVYATQKVQARRSPFAGDPFFERFFGGDMGVPQERAQSSLGSGVIVDPKGLIITNHHVIANANQVRVALSDGREFPAEVMLDDERTDLAVLKIQGSSGNYPILKLSDSDALEVGDLVLAIGDPFGVGQTVTSGIVSALARTDIGANDMSFFIQTDAAINPGNSGGALLDVHGDVVGINSAIYSQSGGNIGIGFAIPSNMVRTVLAQAQAGNKTVERPWIGASYQRVTSEIATSLGLDRPRGALVTDVQPSSPASRAGLKMGDLIVSVDGLEIADPPGLEYRFALAGIGKDVKLGIRRDDRPTTLTLALEKPPKGGAETTIGGNMPLTGATVTDLSPYLAARLHIQNVRSGAVVTKVDPASPAAQLGLRPGDLILRLQGHDISSADQLNDLIKAGSRLWRITIDRGGSVSNLVIGG